jgi:hypothetical protein
MTPGRNGSVAWAIFGSVGGRLGDRIGTGAPAGRRASTRGSSEVPHIPQKRKVGALSSLQFGQITIVLPDVFSYILTLVRHVNAPVRSY